MLERYSGSVLYENSSFIVLDTKRDLKESYDPVTRKCNWEYYLKGYRELFGWAGFRIQNIALREVENRLKPGKVPQGLSARNLLRAGMACDMEKNEDLRGENVRFAGEWNIEGGFIPSQGGIPASRWVRPYWNGFFKKKIFFSYDRCRKCKILYCREFFDVSPTRRALQPDAGQHSGGAAECAGKNASRLFPGI